MARRVAGAVAHVQRLPADLHRIAVVQPAVGREGLGGRKAEHPALLGQARRGRLFSSDSAFIPISFDDEGFGLSSEEG